MNNIDDGKKDAISCLIVGFAFLVFIIYLFINNISFGERLFYLVFFFIFLVLPCAISLHRGCRSIKKYKNFTGEKSTFRKVLHILTIIMSIITGLYCFLPVVILLLVIISAI